MIGDFKNSKSNRIAVSSLLASFSLVLAIISHYLSVPMVPMLKVDISDFPIFLSTFLLGAPSGYIILFAVSFIRSLFFSSAGWTGFIMRMVSCIPIFFIGIYQKKGQKLFLLMICATIFSVFVKIPVSYIFWTKFHFMPPEFIKSIMFPIVIPYNLIKNLVNLLLAYLFYKKMKNFKV